MKFYTVRELSNNTKAVQETIKSEGEAVITNNGKPWALMVDISDSDLFNTITMMRRAKAASAISQLRKDAVSSGKADMTLDEINAEIKASRAERRAMQSADVARGVE